MVWAATPHLTRSKNRNPSSPSSRRRSRMMAFIASAVLSNADAEYCPTLYKKTAPPVGWVASAAYGFVFSLAVLAAARARSALTMERPRSPWFSCANASALKSSASANRISTVFMDEMKNGPFSTRHEQLRKTKSLVPMLLPYSVGSRDQFALSWIQVGPLSVQYLNGSPCTPTV